MATTNKYSAFLLCAAVVLMATSHVNADAYTWTGAGTVTTGSNGLNYWSYNWSDIDNWGGSDYPNAVGDSANITATWFSNDQYIINLDQAVTIGSLFLQGNAPVNWGFGIYGTSYALTFQASSGDATLSAVIPNSNSTAVIQPNVVLNSPLDVNVFSNDPYGYGWTQSPTDYWGRYSHGLIFMGTISGTDEGITKTGLAPCF